MFDRIVAAAICLFVSGSLVADIPALEREVNMVFNHEPPESALKSIEREADVIFAYQPVIVTGIPPVNAVLKNRSVREALVLIFGDKIAFHARNNYIILKPKPPVASGKKKEISGYVYAKQTGQKLAKVTIYDPVSLQSASTDDYGYFELKVPATTPSVSVNRINYQDTALPLHAEPPGLTSIALSPGSPVADSAVWLNRIKTIGNQTYELLRKFSAQVHQVNVRDSISRDWQVSFIPYVGTNHRMSGNVYNKISFNILGGYARGVSAFEAGGLFNLNRENMSGAQFAGLFNIVGDSVKGMQGAGLFNVTGKKQEGAQAAGLMNINGGTASGAQLAGLMNISPVSEGFGAAGLMNISGTTKGALAAGLANITDSLQGFSAAGLFNVSSHGTSAQMAGLFNVADETAFQAAGLFNVANHVKGVQLGVINIADSASGAPIGLLSIVKKGVHQLELSGDEWFYANASFRTGSHKFYNILSAGYQPGSRATLWQVGYGVGTSFRISNRWRLELNLSAHHVSKGAFIWGPSELYRFNPCVEYRLAKLITVAAGPSINLYHTDRLMPEFDHTYSAVTPYRSFSNNTDDFYNQKGWIGGRVAVRFF